MLLNTFKSVDAFENVHKHSCSLQYIEAQNENVDLLLICGLKTEVEECVAVCFYHEKLMLSEYCLLIQTTERKM
jgi:hypothetical protein